MRKDLWIEVRNVPEGNGYGVQHTNVILPEQAVDYVLAFLKLMKEKGHPIDPDNIKWGMIDYNEGCDEN